MLLLNHGGCCCYGDVSMVILQGRVVRKGGRKQSRRLLKRPPAVKISRPQTARCLCASMFVSVTLSQLAQLMTADHPVSVCRVWTSCFRALRWTCWRPERG